MMAKEEQSYPISNAYAVKGDDGNRRTELSNIQC
jgi:hypothetical protein